jgi:hypothetical protein
MYSHEFIDALSQDLGASGKLGMKDLSGGTFSISNIGVVGGTYLSPVVVTPEVRFEKTAARRRAASVPRVPPSHSEMHISGRYWRCRQDSPAPPL